MLGLKGGKSVPHFQAVLLIAAFLRLGIPNLTRVELPTLPLLSVVRLSHREGNRTDTGDWASLAPSLFLNMVTAGNPFGLCALVYKGSL